jgi:hypothetical protein
MKKLLFFLCLLQGLSAIAQQAVLNNTSVGYVGEVYDLSGHPLIGKGYYDVKGTPLFTDNWGTGIIKFSNGNYMKDAPLRFSLYNNQLYSRKGDIEVALVDRVKEFSFVYEENNESHEVLFRNGYPESKPGVGEEQFYQVLVDGPRYQLLKRSYKTIQEVFDYTSAPAKAFNTWTELYIFDAHSRIFTQIKNKQPLADAMPGLAKEMARLSDNQRGKFKSEKDLTELVSKLNR